MEFVFGCGFVEEFVQVFVYCVFDDGVVFDVLVDDGSRDFVFVEVGDLDVLSDVFVGVSDVGFEVVWGDCDGEFDLGWGQFFDGVVCYVGVFFL